MEFEYKLQRIEASLEILESWISSVPGLEQDQSTKTAIESNEIKQEETSNDEPPKIDEPDNVKQDEAKEARVEEQPAHKDPRYEKYFKRVHFGVPKDAVKLAMQQEGLDSSVLDDPQQVVSKPKSTNNGENKGE